jgi:diguanylate cyclase (GGDEF)-like protein/PAS domain S-box-containing protein
MPRSLFHRFREWLSGTQAAYAELRDSEARYRDLVERSPDAIYIHANDRIVYLNRAALDQLGASSPDQVVGRSRFDLVHPDDHAQSIARVRDVYSGQTAPRVHQRYVRLDGSVMHGEVVAMPISYQGEPAVLVFVRDVTERLRAQEALERARAAMDTAPDAIFLVDRDTLRYVDVNAAVCRMLGYTHEDLMHMGPEGVTVDFDADEMRRTFGAVVSIHEQPPQQEGARRELRRKDGTVFPVEIRRSLIHSGDQDIIVSVARDLTDTLRAQAELARFRAAVDVAADAILLVDRETLRFIDANETACRMLGYTREALLAMTPLDINVNLTRARLERDLDEAIALAPQAAPQDSSRYARRADGTIFPIDVFRSARVVDGRPIVVAIVRDITERRRAEQALRLRTRAVEAAENGIVIVNVRHPEQPIEYVNPAFERITGYAASEVLGRNCRFLQGADTDQPDLENLRAALRAGTEGHALLRNYRKDGRLFWNQMAISPVRDDNGTITHYLGISTDVTELTVYRNELEHRASHDILTGLANRSLLDDRLAMALAAAQRHDRALAVAFIDLDHFKEVNDTLGHAAGDELLMAVARRLLACVRDGDTVARQGGDEFILVLTEQASEASVTQVLKRVLEVVARPYPLAGKEVRISCSIGASMYPRDGADAGELIRRADQAMYLAKTSGRNQYRFWEHLDTPGASS